MLGGILVDCKEELGYSTGAINDAVSAQAGQNLYLGEHVVAPSNFGDPDWGLYTGNGTSAENLVKSRRWRYGEGRSVGAAGNDAVFEIRRKG